MRHSRMILASSSPRRRQLLAQWGYSFEVIPPEDAAESSPAEASSETPQQLVARLAWQKARNVAERIDEGFVIGCDTVAECHGQILGKPRDLSHAREMLSLMRGQEHRVYSGLCLWRRPGDNHRVEVDTTRLVMDSLSDDDLAAYLATGEWAGKAGAFGYQDGLDWVHILEGSESNVVGLPMELLARMVADL